MHYPKRNYIGVSRYYPWPSLSKTGLSLPRPYDFVRPGRGVTTSAGRLAQIQPVAAVSGPQRPHEPWSKLLIGGLFRDYIGSISKGYQVVHKEYWRWLTSTQGYQIVVPRLKIRGFQETMVCRILWDLRQVRLGSFGHHVWCRAERGRSPESLCRTLQYLDPISLFTNSLLGFFWRFWAIVLHTFGLQVKGLGRRTPREPNMA